MHTVVTPVPIFGVEALTSSDAGSGACQGSQLRLPPCPLEKEAAPPTLLPIPQIGDVQVLQPGSLASISGNSNSYKVKKQILEEKWGASK